MEERNYEEDARKDGWAPQDEWRGDPEKWKDAKQFVEDGENILPIVKKKMETFEAELAETKAANKQFGEFFQDFKEREKKEKADLRQQLEAKAAQAVTDGDGEAFLEAYGKLNETEPVKPQELTHDQQNWLSSNQWYSVDQDMTAYANGLADTLVAQGYTDQSPAFFAEISSKVETMFPDQFSNKNRSRPSGVEVGGEKVVTDSKARTYENLPAEAKAACDSFVAKIPDFTVEDYVSTYDWESENV